MSDRFDDELPVYIHDSGWPLCMVSEPAPLLTRRNAGITCTIRTSYQNVVCFGSGCRVLRRTHPRRRRLRFSQGGSPRFVAYKLVQLNHNYRGQMRTAAIHACKKDQREAKWTVYCRRATEPLNTGTGLMGKELETVQDGCI